MLRGTSLVVQRLKLHAFTAGIQIEERPEVRTSGGLSSGRVYVCVVCVCVRACIEKHLCSTEEMYRHCFN